MELAGKPIASTVTPLNAIVRMFYEPSAVFAQLESRRGAWVPALLLLLTAVSLAVWYFQFVDYAWLQEQWLALIEDPAVREQQRNAPMALSTVTGMTVFGIVIAYLLGFTITAVYLLIVSKVRNVEFSFGKGFALSAWSSVPLLIMFPLGAMQILLAANNQFGFEALNPLTLNQLYFNYEPTHSMAGLLEGVSLLMFWNIFLLVIGYEIWGKASRATAIKVVVAPYIVIYGLWLAFALSRTA